MTYEEAKAKFLLEYCPKCGEPLPEQCAVCEIDMAIKALEIQTHNCKDCWNADRRTDGMTTQIESIKKMAITFLYSEIQETEISFIVHHPFTSLTHVIMMVDDEGIPQLCDLRNPQYGELWRNGIKERIEKASIDEIFMMLGKPYILKFLKCTECYMSDKDLKRVLEQHWKSIEQFSLNDSMTQEETLVWLRTEKKDTAE